MIIEHETIDANQYDHWERFHILRNGNVVLRVERLYNHCQYALIDYQVCDEYTFYRWLNRYVDYDSHLYEYYVYEIRKWLIKR